MATNSGSQINEEESKVSKVVDQNPEPQLPEVPSYPLVSSLKIHLNDWDFVEADKDIEKSEDQDWIKENGAWELIPIIVEYLDEEHERTCPQLVSACGQLLQKLATKCPPKETLIALIEHCEAFQSDIKFRNILPALGVVFQSLASDHKAKLALTLDWTLDTLVSHLHAIVLPELPLLEDLSEWCTLDSMPEVLDVIKVVSAFVDFLEPLVTKINVEKGENISSKEAVKCQHLLKWSLIEALAFPLVFLNLRVHVPKTMPSGSSKLDERCFKPSARIVVERITRNICRLSSNIIDLIDYQSVQQTLNRDKFKENKEKEITNWQLAIGTLFYIIYDDGAELDPKERQDFLNFLPICYNPNHILHLLLPSIICMTDEKHNYLSLHKGLGLAFMLIERMEAGSLHIDVLQMKVHTTFLENLIRISIFSQSQEMRKSAYNLFEKYFFLFEQNFARYRLVSIILDIANHSGFIGQTIVKIKDTILKQMSAPPDQLHNMQFCGHNMKVLIRKICKLKHGAETDLLEISDEIMASLNLLVCLMIKDKVNSNITGVWDLKNELKTNLIKPLETGISMSRGHYQLKLKEKPTKADGGIEEVTLMVGGQKLPYMSYDEMAKVIHAALNTFDMMECVLCQLNDVMDRT